MSVDEKNPATTTSEAVPATATEATTTATDSGTPVAAATADVTTEQARPRRRGFAAMDRSRVKEIASKGGRAAHAAGTAHQFSADEARVAGKKGGLAPHVRRGGVFVVARSVMRAAPSSQQFTDGR